MLADLGFQIFRLAFFLSRGAYGLTGFAVGAGFVSRARFLTAGTLHHAYFWFQARGFVRDRGDGRNDCECREDDRCSLHVFGD